MANHGTTHGDDDRLDREANGWYKYITPNIGSILTIHVAHGYSGCGERKIMKRKITGFFLFLFCTAFLAAPCPAAVEMQVLKTLDVASPPLDMEMSKDGKWIFTLTSEGIVEIYSLDGKLKEKLNVGPNVDQIKAGPRDDLLLLKSTKDQTVQILAIDFIQSIDITGSPVNGLPEAPVAVVVFSDFQ